MCFPLCQKFRGFRLEIKWNSSVRPENVREKKEPPLKEVHFDRLDQSVRNLPLHFDKPEGSLPYFSSVDFHLCRGLGKGIENGKSHSSRLARFDQKMLFHFTTDGQSDKRLANLIKCKASRGFDS